MSNPLFPSTYTAMVEPCCNLLVTLFFRIGMPQPIHQLRVAPGSSGDATAQARRRDYNPVGLFLRGVVISSPPRPVLLTPTAYDRI